MKTFYFNGKKAFTVECDMALYTCPIIHYARGIGAKCKLMDGSSGNEVAVDVRMPFNESLCRKYHSIKEDMLDECMYCGQKTR